MVASGLLRFGLAAGEAGIQVLDQAIDIGRGPGVRFPP